MVMVEVGRSGVLIPCVQSGCDRLQTSYITVSLYVTIQFRGRSLMIWGGGDFVRRVAEKNPSKGPPNRKVTSGQFNPTKYFYVIPVKPCCKKKFLWSILAKK